MAYKQTKDFDPNKGGRQNGYCLKNVRLGYGIASKWSNAITAWNNTEQHRDKSIPGGVEVPLYYTYGKDGHINVRLTDGRIWNDGTVFASLSDYLAKRPQVKYLGWGESVNEVRVIQYVPDPPKPTTSGKRLYFDPIGQTVTFYKVSGGTYAMKIKDATYNWSIKKHEGTRVLINSASAGGDCWVYLTYSSTGSKIPGRYVK